MMSGTALKIISIGVRHLKKRCRYAGSTAGNPWISMLARAGFDSTRWTLASTSHCILPVTSSMWRISISTGNSTDCPFGANQLIFGPDILRSLELVPSGLVSIFLALSFTNLTPLLQLSIGLGSHDLLPVLVFKHDIKRIFCFRPVMCAICGIRRTIWLQAIAFAVVISTIVLRFDELAA